VGTYRLRSYGASSSKIDREYHNQGRVRLRARWAIAQGPQLSRGPKEGKKVKKAYENQLSRD